MDLVSKRLILQKSRTTSPWGWGLVAPKLSSEPDWHSSCLLEGVKHGQILGGLIAACGLLCLVNCGGTGSGYEGGSSSSEGGSTIQVTPSSVSVLLGDSVTFAARDDSGEDVAVVWSVNGIPGGNSSEGIISKSGQYTAPGVLPASDAIQI